MKTIEELEAALTIAEERILELQNCQVQPEQEPVAKYSDIVSDGGLDPRNKFDTPPQRTERHELQAKGEHPAPCARHCEANAFQIVIKNLKAQLAQPEQEPVLQDIEQYRLQMAGICTAAIGYWKEGDGIHPDYDTVALRDVAKLYAKYDELYREQPAQKPDHDIKEKNT